MQDLMKGLSQTARMSLIMGSTCWIPISWNTRKNKIGVAYLIRGIWHADAQCPGGTLVSGKGQYVLLSVV